LTKINLIPPEKKKEKRRRPGAPGGPPIAWLLLIIPVIVVILMVMLYLSASNKVKTQQTALKEKQTELADWQSKNAQLAKYSTRQQEIAQTEATVVNALRGRVYWARILNEVAIMIPKDVWLVSLNGTSTQNTSGTVTFEAYALQCPNRLNKGFWSEAGEDTAGNQHWPYLPDYRPVAGWLERMAQISEFQRIWLSSALPAQIQSGAPTTATTSAATWVMRFSSQATLNMDTATVEGTTTSSPTASAPTPTPSSSPSTSSTSAPGGR
jgi:Tfp pilus assembly protein PilN